MSNNRNNTLAQRVLCLGIRTSCLGTSMLDNEETEKVLSDNNAKKGSLRVQRTRLKNAIAPFRQLRGELNRWYRSISLPGISDDLRLIPSSRLEAIREKFQTFVDRDAELLRKLRDNYEKEIEADKVLLGERFDPSLYPAKEDLGQAFSLSLQVMDLPSGDFERLSNLTAADRARLKAEHDAMVTQMGVAARTEVVSKLTALISKVAEKLTDPDAEVYRESTLTNLKEYLAEVPSLNVTNDPTITAMATAAQERLNFTMAELKKSQFMKEQAANAAKEILANFGALGSTRKMVA